MALGLSNPVDSGSVEPQKPPLTPLVREPVTYVQDSGLKVIGAAYRRLTNSRIIRIRKSQLAEAHRKLRFPGRCTVQVRAGRIDEIKWHNNWVVLDVGFAKTGTKSSGLGLGSSPPVELTFADAKSAIINYVSDSTEPINFVIEAPLSVAFDSKGNPIGRRFEKRGGDTRYWYSGLAASISIATLHLLQAMINHSCASHVRLFEGFATFKPKGKSNHIADVEALRRVIKGEQGEVIPPHEFAANMDDQIESLFDLIGVKTGISPLLVPW